MTRRWIVLTAALALLFAAACSGSGGSSGDDAAPPDVPNLSEQDLALMVLPSEDMDRLGELLDPEPGEDSGFIDNEQRAEDFSAVETTADDLAAIGRVSGYDLEYLDFSVLGTGEGVFGVGTGVDLYEDREGASAFFARWVDEGRRLEGFADDEIIVDSSQEFEVDDLGDEAIGFRSRVRFVGFEAEMSITVVYFRRGRLVGASGIAHFDDTNRNQQAEWLARRVDGRIRTVLAGGFAGTPVPLSPGPEDLFVSPPPGTPDLAAMALTVDDLPPAAGIEFEGYFAEDSTVATYERQFEFDGVLTVGSTELISLESELDLYATAEEASGSLRSFVEYYEGEEGVRRFAAAISQGIGIDLTGVEIGSQALSFGDESVAVIATSDFALGRTTWVFLHVRVDNVVGLVGAAGPAESFRLDDLLPLVERMDERMRAELSRQPAAAQP